MTAGCALRRTVLPGFALLLAVLALGQAAAQAGWTVQVMALRDFSEAQQVADQLDGLGFDAYTEFAMRDGRQFVRVRVGCFSGREAAVAIAEAMAATVTREAVAVPISPGADIVACVEIDIGFLKPTDWRQLDDTSGSFEVVIGGESAVIAHTGERWAIRQDGAAPPAARAAHAFRQTNTHGLTLVQVDTPAGTLNLCQGRLLAAVADIAIVERREDVVACRLLTPTGARP